MLFPDTSKHPDQRYLLSPKGNELLQTLISLENRLKHYQLKIQLCRNDVGTNLVKMQQQYF